MVVRRGDRTLEFERRLEDGTVVFTDQLDRAPERFAIGTLTRQIAEGRLQIVRGERGNPKHGDTVAGRVCDIASLDEKYVRELAGRLSVINALKRRGLRRGMRRAIAQELPKVKVWWHGIGTRSHVELPRASAPGVVVDLDTAQAHLIRNHRARCMDLPGAYFDSGSGQLTDDGRKELLDAVSRWTQREMNDARLEQIRVVGHTDPMTPASGTTNRALSNERAKAVVQALRDSGLLKEFFTQDASTLSGALRIEGDAARQPLKECSTSSSLAERRECNAVNRRVELRLFFGPKNAAAQKTVKSDS